VEEHGSSQEAPLRGPGLFYRGISERCLEVTERYPRVVVGLRREAEYYKKKVMRELFMGPEKS
jgi:hypothetical protein